MPDVSTLVSRLDAYQRGHRWLGFPLSVLYKFFEDQGNYLAAIITYYGLVSLFPLLLLAVTVLGFVLRGDPQLQARLLNSALAQFPVIGNQLRTSTHSLTGSGAGLVVGIVGALYGGLGVVQAGQNAFNRAWAIPRQDRPDPIHARGRSLVLLPVLGTNVIVTTVLSDLTAGAASYLGPPARAGGIALSVILNVVTFVVAFRILTARPLSTRDVIVGATIAASCWQILQLVGSYYMRHALRGASVTAGTFGIVLGLLAWIYVEAVITVLCVEINVVLHRELWPRALMSLLSDTDRLTPADLAAYRSYPPIERYKTFADISVRFRHKEVAPAPASGPPTSVAAPAPVAPETAAGEVDDRG